MPGHTLVEKCPAGSCFSVWHLVFIFLSLSSHTITQPVVHSVQHGPSMQGSFTPAKDPPQFKGRT